MIAVMGATGSTGRAVVERLLDAGRKVRVIGRSAERLKRFVDRGAEPITGDASDAAVLTSALSGADAVYAMVPPDYGQPDPRAYYHRFGETIEKAARQSGVRRIVFLSSVGAELPSGTGPIAGLHVRAFDKDLLFDDKLGVAVTDAEGKFRIDYSQLDFSSIFGTETSPELYVRVYDVNDKKLLYTSEKSIRKNVKVEEHFEIKIPRGKLL